MKCDTTNAVLTFFLGALILLDVVFAVQTVMYTRQFRSLQFEATQDQLAMARMQQIDAVAREAVAYNQKNPNPELTRILQGTQGKPSAK